MLYTKTAQTEASSYVKRREISPGVYQSAVTFGGRGARSSKTRGISRETEIEREVSEALTIAAASQDVMVLRTHVASLQVSFAVGRSEYYK